MVKIYLDINFHEERILSTLSKVNQLLILIEIVWHVKIYLNINFHEERILSTLHVKIYLDINLYEERILSTLAKVNRLLLLIKNCSAA
ncbi:uncharacterized protein OCT59_014221 [Rhizophagus irregularis]|uniref:uncharacterized protein n=1 Tax=Rhizophagus irregularis TaxID=588596 RepID=UPI00332E322A|nr:hypothetical protein OCT59_014221 [Rhizophagus irregularis]